MTKEELLQKGVSDEAADEIMSAFSDENVEDNSLLALQKALDGDPEMDSLFKAEKKEGDEKDEDDEYDESYMKKHMKRYMKANKKSVSKMVKDFGDSGEDMKKAIEDIDTDSEGAVVEMVNLAPYLESQNEFNQKMVKAISDLHGQIEVVSVQTEKSFDLIQKAAKVQIEQAKEVNTFLSVPKGRKGVIASAEMMKAGNVESSKFSRDDNNIIYRTLMKATKEKDTKAGMIISSFETAGHDANRLNASQKQYIQELLAKEAN